MSRSSLPYLAIVALAIAVRLPGLLEPLWWDELYATRIVLRNLASLGWITIHDLHPPLYASVMFGWIRIFGDSELSIRILPLISGVTTVALMPALGRRLATERAGWIAAVFLALSPAHIWYSREARTYAVVMLLGVVAVLVAGKLSETVDTDRWGRRFLGAAMALVLTHFYGFFVLGVVALWSIRFPSRARREVLGGVGLCVMLVGALLVFKTQVGMSRASTWYLGVFTIESIPGLLRWLLVGSHTGTPFPWLQRVFYGLAIGLVVIGLVRRSAVAVSPAVLCGLVLGIPVTLLLVGMAGIDQYYIDRSALGMLPFLLLALGAGADAFSRVRVLREAVLLVLLTGGSASLVAYLNGRAGLTVAVPKPDWRAAIQVLEAHRAGSGGRPAVVVGAAPLDELKYYLPGIRGCDVRSLRESTGATCSRTSAATTPSDHIYQLPADSVPWIQHILVAESTTTALYIDRTSWRAHSESVLQAIRNDTSLTLTELGTVRGLQFWRIGVR